VALPAIRRALRPVPVALLALLVTLAAPRRPAAAQATSLTFVVTSTADAPDAHPGDGVCADTAGQCTLRAAMQEANVQLGGSVITISVPAGTYNLTLGPLNLLANTVAIDGAGAPTTVIVGRGSRVLSVSSAARALLAGLTITGGDAVGDNGGGIHNAGALVLSHSSVVSNTAGQPPVLPVSCVCEWGGGIYNAAGATLDAVDSVIMDNMAGFGAGIANDGGTVTLTASTLRGNVTWPDKRYMPPTPLSSMGDGGGLATTGGSVTLTTSAVISNTAHTLVAGGFPYGGNGGGLANLQGTMTLTGSVVAGNVALAPNSYPPPPNGLGGGIDNAGLLTVINSRVSTNMATTGGGIANEAGGHLTLRGGTTSGNDGGGIANGGVMTVETSTISGNTAGTDPRLAGGITNGNVTSTNGGSMTLTNSVVSGNTGEVGGIANNTLMTVDASTIAANTTNRFGYVGGIVNSSGAVMAVRDSTVTGNTTHGTGLTAGGFFNYGALTLSYDTIASNSTGIVNSSDSIVPAPTVVLTGTIAAGSTAGPNCRGAIAEAQGDNLDSGTSCGFNRRSDLTKADPRLGPLADNGGPTPTIAVLAGSPAIDHGGTAAIGCPASDQRGMPRPDEPDDHGACDIGAYESGR
jgi:CSLREA domain-containing protein